VSCPCITALQQGLQGKHVLCVKPEVLFTRTND